jgi:1-acyl-sn-glycerol-3-phosphate acyltransferase
MSDAQADALPAIPATRNWLGNQLIYWGLIRFPLWQSFAAVRVQTIGRIPLPHAGALICYMNHPAWWDGYMCAIINRMLLHRGGKHYVMMEEQQLRAYRFFTWAGVFSVHRQKPREAIRAIRYSSRKLQEAAGETLFIFPQGEITPNDQRPLRLFPGLVHIVRHMGKATLAPVALRYEFRGEQRPDIFIRFGPVHTVQTPLDVRQVQTELTTRLTANVESLREAVAADDMHQFRVLLRGSPSINTVFDQVVRLLR